jgi:hypothetical protein
LQQQQLTCSQSATNSTGIGLKTLLMLHFNGTASLN